MERNSDVKLYAYENGIKLWMIAEKLGITDSTFSRRLRKKLSLEDKEKIFKIVDDLKRGGRCNE